MDRPYGISDFAFPSRWDRESGPDLAGRAGQGSPSDREQSQTGRGKGSNSTQSRGGFDPPGTVDPRRDPGYSPPPTAVPGPTTLATFRLAPAHDLLPFLIPRPPTP